MFFKKIFIIFTLLLFYSLYSQSYIPGHHYFSTNKTVEYIAGNLPIIISAPHGGRMKPSWVPDRKNGTTVMDTNTDYLAQAISSAIHNLTGHYAHIIINHLHRSKVDCNRDEVEGAQGNKNALATWKSFHQFIQVAKTQVVEKYKKGIYIDLHGHGHPIQRLELGYLLTKDDLNLPNSELEKKKSISSIRNLANQKKSFVELIRGKIGFGGIWEEVGYPAIPSPKYTKVGNDPYFSGGYNTREHGSLKGGTIDGIQIECNFKGVRDTEDARTSFARAFALAIRKFLKLHYDIDI